MKLKNILVIFLVIIIPMSFILSGEKTFKQKQMTYPRFRTALTEKDSIVNEIFTSKNMDYPPENIFIMAVGPLTATKTPTGSRYMIMTKSPLTGTVTCSNSGGKFPKELKKTGYDAQSASLHEKWLLCHQIDAVN